MCSPDVVCVGLIVADHVSAPIEAFPPAGGLVTTPKLELTIGGCAANVAVDLARLNVPTAIVGRVGNDPLGGYVRDVLAESGVDSSQIVLSDTAQTSATLVVNVAGEDRRFIHAVGANAELTGAEVTDALIREAKVLYVGGFGLNAALSGERVAELFQRARAANVQTLLDVVVGDPAQVREMLVPALPWTDLFLPNVDEARALTGREDPREQIEAFLEAGAKTVVVTAGPAGVFLGNQEGTRLSVPAHQVEQIDGTGGGDAFAAGFMYGLLQEADPADCLQFGAAMGASCVQHPGATTGVFDESQLREFVMSHRLTVAVQA